jgi:hypothetical protein
MKDNTSFALVVPMSSLTRKTRPFDFAVCVVANDEASFSFVDLDGLDALVGELPCLPSQYGRRAAQVSLEAEREALSMLIDETRRFISRYGQDGPPLGFDSLRTFTSGGLMVDVDDRDISLDITSVLAEASGLKLGDRVDLCFNPFNHIFMLYPDKDGAKLIEGEQFGWLSTERSWPLPHGFDLTRGKHSIEYFVGDRGVSFRLGENLNLRAAVSVDKPNQDDRLLEVTAPTRRYGTELLLGSLLVITGLLVIFTQ